MRLHTVAAQHELDFIIIHIALGAGNEAFVGCSLQQVWRAGVAVFVCSPCVGHGNSVLAVAKCLNPSLSMIGSTQAMR